ncbi:MAG: glycosyltransferase family 2 protein [Bacteroidales bacterium]|nr:glycosyltransferase family 2 protein [Bacteroidales bacterium]
MDIEENGVEDQKRVSICMIVKDEEANLTRCLDSLLPIIREPWAELIIVDTGSKDRSVEVARKYTDKVFVKEFIPWNFSEARNYGIAKATGKLIFCMDADEQIAQDSIYPLMDILWNPKYDEFNTFFFTLHNYNDRECRTYATMTQPRVFRNTGKPIYSGDVHNRPECETPYLMVENVIIRHYGYVFQGKPELFAKKCERTLPMLEKNHAENPDDLHILTHLVKQYYVMKRWNDVITSGEKWVKLMRGADYNEGWFSFLEGFIDLVHAYSVTKNRDSMLRTIHECEQYSTRVAAVYFIAGDHFAVAGEPEVAAEYFARGVEVLSTKGSPYESLLTTNARAILPQVLHWLAIHHFRNRDYARAGEYANAGIAVSDPKDMIRWDIWNEEMSLLNLIQKVV